MNEMSTSIGCLIAATTLAIMAICPMLNRVRRMGIVAGVLSLWLVSGLVFVGSICAFNTAISFGYASKLMAKNASYGVHATKLVISFDAVIERDTENARIAGTDTADAWFSRTENEIHISPWNFIGSPTTLAHEYAHAVDASEAAERGLWHYYLSASKKVLDTFDAKGLAKINEETRMYSSQNTTEAVACLYEAWVAMTPASFETKYGKEAAEFMVELEKIK